MAAIHGKAEYLLTGDARHFEHLYGKRIEGVLVLYPDSISAGDDLFAGHVIVDGLNPKFAECSGSRPTSLLQRFRK